jgi:hypothetical protein
MDHSRANLGRKRVALNPLSSVPEAQKSLVSIIDIKEVSKQLNWALVLPSLVQILALSLLVVAIILEELAKGIFLVLTVVPQVAKRDEGIPESGKSKLRYLTSGTIESTGNETERRPRRRSRRKGYAKSTLDLEKIATILDTEDTKHVEDFDRTGCSLKPSDKSNNDSLGYPQSRRKNSTTTDMSKSSRDSSTGSNLPATPTSKSEGKKPDFSEHGGPSGTLPAIKDTFPYTIVVKPSGQLPIPGNPGAPYFDGRNVSEFIEQLKDLFKECESDLETRRNRLVRYTTPVEREEIKSMPEYAEPVDLYNEEKFYEALRHKYRDQDWDKLRDSYDFLQRVMAQGRIGAIDARTYVTTFNRVSTELIKRNEIDESQRCRAFMEGASIALKDKLLRNTRFDYSDVATHKYAPMLEEGRRHWELEEKKRRYNESHDPALARSRDDHIDAVIRDYSSHRETYNLPAPPVAYRYGLGETSQRHDESVRFPTPPAVLRPKKSGGVSFQDPPTRQEGSARQATTTASGVEEMTRMLEKFNLSQAEIKSTMQKAIEDNGRILADQFKTAMMEIKLAQGPALTYNQLPQRSYAPQSRGYGNQGQPRGPTLQGNTVEFQPLEGYNQEQMWSLEANAFGQNQGLQGPRMCLGCFGRDWNNAPDLYCNHFHTNQCDKMQDLMNRGCCHKDVSDSGRYCYGPWNEDKSSVPIQLRTDAPWVNQIKAKVQGGPHDYNIKDRPKNIRRIEEEVAMAQKATLQGSAAAIRNGNYGDLEIMRREQIGAITLDGNCGLLGVKDITSGKLNNDWQAEYYQEVRTLEGNNTGVKPAGVSKVRRPTKLSEKAKAALQERAEAEEGLPRPKTQRPGGIGLVPSQEQPVDMDVDLTISEDDELAPERTQTLRIESDSDELVPRPRKRKTTVPLPRTQRGHKMIIDAMKTPSPLVTIIDQFSKDTAHYIDLIEIGATLSSRMIKAAIPNTELLESLNRLLNPSKTGSIMASGTQGSNPQRIALGGKEGGVGFLALPDLLEKKFIVSSPKVSFTLRGPNGKMTLKGVLDTGAECNILPSAIARKLGVPIRGADNFVLSTATGAEYGFDGMSTIRIELMDNIGCDDAFFLVKDAPKVLLGQPFISKMKMRLTYQEDGSWDGRFHDPADPLQRCSIMVVPPLQEKRMPIIPPRPSVEEVDDENVSSGED